MSIFGNNRTQYSVPANESYTIYDGDICALEEASLDMEGVIESLHAHDMTEIQRDREIAAMESNGARAYEIERIRENYSPIMEGFVKDSWEKLKKLLKDLWEKLKGYFKNLIRFFDGFILSGKKFVTKYENQLTSLNLSGFKYEMYKWDNGKLNASTDVTGYPKKITDAINADSFTKAASDRLTKDKKVILNKMRGAMLGQSGEIKSEKYTEELFKYFRNDARDKNSKREIAVDITELIDALKEDDQINTLKKLEKEIDSEFSDMLSTLTDAQSEYKDKEDVSASAKSNGVSVHQKKISLFKDGHAIALQFVKAWKDAYVERNKEYKGACVAAFRFKEK